MIGDSPSGSMTSVDGRSGSGRSPKAAPAIVVADLDREAARSIARRLTLRGFRALHTTSGRDVLDLVRTRRVILTILDVALADMSGLELASRLRDVDGRMCVVVTAADHQPEIELRARAAGVLLYAPKPVPFETIASIADRVAGYSSSSSREASRGRGAAASRTEIP